MNLSMTIILTTIARNIKANNKTEKLPYYSTIIKDHKTIIILLAGSLPKL